MPDLSKHRVENLRLHTYAFLKDGKDLYVDVKKIWELPGPEYMVPVRHLEHALRELCWEDRSPMDCGHLFPHWDLMLEADLGYPIIITFEPNREERWKPTIVDGRHRLFKAWLEGLPAVKVKFVEYALIIQEAHVEDPNARYLTLGA